MFSGGSKGKIWRKGLANLEKLRIISIENTLRENQVLKQRAPKQTHQKHQDTKAIARNFDSTFHWWFNCQLSVKKETLVKL